jgi:hypothetical protein
VGVWLQKPYDFTYPLKSGSDLFLFLGSLKVEKLRRVVASVITSLLLIKFNYILERCRFGRVSSALVELSEPVGLREHSGYRG